MDTNQFLIYNDLIYMLYTSSQADEHFCHEILSYLRMLVPSSYASLLITDPESDEIGLSSVCCDPVSFTEAEKRYLKFYHQDQTAWVMRSRVSEVLRESDLLPEERRLHSTLYESCYKPYHIFDTLQMSIVSGQRPIAVATLFHTVEDPLFTNADISLLKSLARHLDYVFGRLILHNGRAAASPGGSPLPEGVHLTRRETEILSLIYAVCSNQEICERLHITDHTLQKHLQNIYRKTGVSSRMELFRYHL